LRDSNTAVTDNIEPAIDVPKLIQVSNKGSDPILIQIWREIRKLYFADREDIDDYTVVWSTRRQKRTLASCNVRRRRIVVARELRYPDYLGWLSPLLYHEMCHAILGFNVAQRNRKRLWHGAEFRALESRHPGIIALDSWIKSGGWFQAVRRERARSRTKTIVSLIFP